VKVTPGDAGQAPDIGPTVEALLSALPPGVASAIRLGAIPNWFDGQMLSFLARGEAEVSQALAYLDRLRFARKDAQGRFRYQGPVRDYFLARWRETDLDDYLVANEQALAYFARLAEAASRAERPAYERELLYHLLIVDELRGLDYLADRFERAYEGYQLSLAEGFVARAADLEASLSDEGRAWLRYFQARLDQIYHRGDEGEGVFRDLAEGAPSATLWAMALSNLGGILVSQQQWSEAVRLYRNGLEALPRKGAPLYRARLMLGLGDVYHNLADSCSGSLVEGIQPSESNRRFLHRLQYLPFLIYEGLVHRVGFLPNWFFGMSYQDWVLAYLRLEATRWYRRARREFRSAENGQILVEVELRLAELEGQLGRWSQAQRRYQRLLEADEVQGSLYRTARVRLGQGRILLYQGAWHLAGASLVEAAEVFRRVQDLDSLGVNAALLGQLHAVQGRSAQAVSAYVESARAFEATGSQLAQTQVAWALEDVVAGGTLEGEQQRQAEVVAGQVSQRMYISRFPETLLHWFRRLALLGALPLTYVLSFVLGIALILAIVIVEGSLVTALAGHMAAQTVMDVLTLVAAATLPVFLALWLYRLIYTLMGVAVVYVLGRRLIPIEREQPCYYVADEEGLVRYDPNRRSTESVAWPEVARWASVDLFQRRARIELLSNTILVAGSGPTVVVGGITAGYGHLKQDIGRHMDREPGEAPGPDLDFRILSKGWVAATGALCLAFALYCLITGCIAVFAGPTESAGLSRLDLSGFTFSFVSLMLLLFPAVTLWRLVGYRRAVRARLGYEPRTLPPWLLWLAAIFCTVMAMLWILAVVRFA
jgi:hypothetical protein